jgi:hypothetical protein
MWFRIAGWSRSLRSKASSLHRSNSRARCAARRHSRLSLESLEDHCVPTVGLESAFLWATAAIYHCTRP